MGVEIYNMASILHSVLTYWYLTPFIYSGGDGSAVNCCPHTLFPSHLLLFPLSPVECILGPGMSSLPPQVGDDPFAHSLSFDPSASDPISLFGADDDKSPGEFPFPLVICLGIWPHLNPVGACGDADDIPWVGGGVAQSQHLSHWPSPLSIVVIHCYSVTIDRWWWWSHSLMEMHLFIHCCRYIICYLFTLYDGDWVENRIHFLIRRPNLAPHCLTPSISFVVVRYLRCPSLCSSPTIPHYLPICWSLSFYITHIWGWVVGANFGAVGALPQVGLVVSAVFLHTAALLHTPLLTSPLTFIPHTCCYLLFTLTPYFVVTPIPRICALLVVGWSGVSWVIVGDTFVSFPFYFHSPLTSDYLQFYLFGTCIFLVFFSFCHHVCIFTPPYPHWYTLLQHLLLLLFTHTPPFHTFSLHIVTFSFSRAISSAFIHVPPPRSLSFRCLAALAHFVVRCCTLVCVWLNGRLLDRAFHATFAL